MLLRTQRELPEHVARPKNPKYKSCSARFPLTWRLSLRAAARGSHLRIAPCSAHPLLSSNKLHDAMRLIAANARASKLLNGIDRQQHAALRNRLWRRALSHLRQAERLTRRAIIFEKAMKRLPNPPFRGTLVTVSDDELSVKKTAGGVSIYTCPSRTVDLI
jgi:hypothetical protein